MNSPFLLDNDNDVGITPHSRQAAVLFAVARGKNGHGSISYYADLLQTFAEQNNMLMIRIFIWFN